jgi:hypothetical protein
MFTFNLNQVYGPSGITPRLESGNQRATTITEKKQQKECII